MTSRPLTALAAGALVSGALFSVAAPASAADPCYPPHANCASQGGIQVSKVYDPSTNTVTITVTGLRNGSTVTVVVVLPSSAAHASYHGGSPDVSSAVYHAGGTAAPVAFLATSRSVSGTADSRGVATLQVPLSSFGNLTDAQINALVFAVSGTAANGSRVSFDTGITVHTGAGGSTGSGTTGSSGSSGSTGSGSTGSGSTGSGSTGSGSGGSTGSTASGSALPRTGTDLVPIGVAGATLVLGGAGVVLLSRRRRRAGASALGA